MSRRLGVLAMMASARAFVAPTSRSAVTGVTRRFISVGDSAPAVKIVNEWPNVGPSFDKMIAGKKVMVVGLPGAFTPT